MSKSGRFRYRPYLWSFHVKRGKCLWESSPRFLDAPGFRAGLKTVVVAGVFVDCFLVLATKRTQKDRSDLRDGKSREGRCWQDRFAKGQKNRYTGGANAPLKVIVFGIVSGLLWSTVPGTLSELFRSGGETASVLLSGALTGMFTSLLLAPYLAKGEKWRACKAGLISLPLGGFIFGVTISLVQFAWLPFTEAPYRFAERFSPLMAGVEYAVLSVVSIFALILFPLAFLTTFGLRCVLRSQWTASRK